MRITSGCAAKAPPVVITVRMHTNPVHFICSTVGPTLPFGEIGEMLRNPFRVLSNPPAWAQPFRKGGNIQERVCSTFGTGERIFPPQGFSFQWVKRIVFFGDFARAFWDKDGTDQEIKEGGDEMGNEHHSDKEHCHMAARVESDG